MYLEFINLLLFSVFCIFCSSSLSFIQFFFIIPFFFIIFRHFQKYFQMHFAQLPFLSSIDVPLFIFMSHFFSVFFIFKYVITHFIYHLMYLGFLNLSPFPIFSFFCFSVSFIPFNFYQL